MEKELFALLRLGLGNSTPEEEALSDFIMMSAEKWAQLGEKALEQGVLGIVLDGVEQLEATPFGPTRGLSKHQKLEWIGQIMQMEQGNRHQIDVMNDLANKWTNEGCKVMVMKGQANGLLYPNSLHRSPGDIDCYLFDNYVLGNKIAKREGAQVDESWYKHSQISYKDELFENHLFFVHTREGKRSKRLQKELEDALSVSGWETFPNSCILLPPVQWNAMFLTYHACAHFMTEGLHIKQVLDWAMFLKKEQLNVNWSDFYLFCERHHLLRFAEAITSICVKHLGIKVLAPSLVTESPYSHKVLQSALYDDDYIYGGEESRWGGRIHLIKSLFRHKWKYQEIYQQSVWKQLWWYMTGFLFHTEG